MVGGFGRWRPLTFDLPAAAVHSATAARKVAPRGLEPRTLRLLAIRSKQLSYETFWSFESSAA